jgi:hypothetical protein
MNRFVDMGPAIGSKCNLFKQACVRLFVCLPVLHCSVIVPYVWVWVCSIPQAHE